MAVSFYSYKGGVGRTSIMANVGWTLASAGFDVLMIDCDLDAPGLPRYLPDIKTASKSKGFLDLIDEVAEMKRADSETFDEFARNWPGTEQGPIAPKLEEFRLDATPARGAQGCEPGQLHVIPSAYNAGTVEYAQRLDRLSVRELDNRFDLDNLLGWLIERIETRYDIVLIDCRPGFSDIGRLITASSKGIVFVTAVSTASLEGIDRAIDYFVPNKKDVGEEGMSGTDLTSKPIWLVTSRVPDDLLLMLREGKRPRDSDLSADDREWLSLYLELVKKHNWTDRFRDFVVPHNSAESGVESLWMVRATSSGRSRPNAGVSREEFQNESGASSKHETTEATEVGALADRGLSKDGAGGSRPLAHASLARALAKNAAGPEHQGLARLDRLCGLLDRRDSGSDWFEVVTGDEGVAQRDHRERGASEAVVKAAAKVVEDGNSLACYAVGEEKEGTPLAHLAACFKNVIWLKNAGHVRRPTATVEVFLFPSESSLDDSAAGAVNSLTSPSNGLRERIRIALGAEGLTGYASLPWETQMRFSRVYCLKDAVAAQSVLTPMLEALESRPGDSAGFLGVDAARVLAEVESAPRRDRELERLLVVGVADDETVEIVRRLNNTALKYEETTGSAKKWWDAFYDENRSRERLPLVVALQEALLVRNATLTEFFLAYVYSNTDNIMGNLHYLDYTRVKKREEQQRKEQAAAQGRDDTNVEHDQIAESHGEDTDQLIDQLIDEILASPLEEDGE